ncbi:UNVERIFIED_CONTAM: hypothetical protein GTU68_035371 [Idotea baltica]|nr:hypothetical protein [Idotea baltica]
MVRAVLAKELFRLD